MSNPHDAKDEESTLSPQFHGSDTEKPEDGNAPPLTPEEFAPPDGGFKAWSTVLGATLVSLSTFGYVGPCHSDPIAVDSNI